jgi:aspartate aminotransferase
VTARISQAARRVATASQRPALGTRPAGAVSLAMGEPDFATHPVVVAAAHEALLGGATHYVDQQGDPDLRAAVTEDLLARRRFQTDPQHVLITHGATAALAATILAVVDPGDRVVIPEPCYSLYPDLVHLAGGTPVFVPAADNLHWDLDHLAHQARGAKLVVFSNPCNPTGIVHTRQELEALESALDGSDTLVISDEAYDTIIFDGRPFTSALEVHGLRDRTIYCQTLSKSHAMTGWRIGYATGPSEVMSAVSRVHRTFNGCINAATQKAAAAAIRAGDDHPRQMLKTYARRRDQITARLSQIPELEVVSPEGTFYVFPKYNLPGVSSLELTAQLGNAGVLVRAGSEYGPSGEGRIRLSFAAGTKDIDTALERMTRALRRAAAASAGELLR